MALNILNDENHIRQALKDAKQETNVSTLKRCLLEWDKIPEAFREILYMEDLEEIAFKENSLIFKTNKLKAMAVIDLDTTNIINNWIRQAIISNSGLSLNLANPYIDSEVFIDVSKVSNMSDEDKIRFKKMKLRLSIMDTSITGNEDFISMQVRINNYQSRLTEEQFTSLIHGWDDPKTKVYANEVATWFEELISKNKKPNIIISGPTGTGKTEVQKYLVKYIPFDHKVVLLQDTGDARLEELYPEKDIIEIYAKKPNTSRDAEDSEDGINMFKGIRMALRQNPVWLMIAEIRGEEAVPFWQAATTGHNVITTIHASNARGTIERLSDLTGEKFELIEKNIDVVINLGIRYNDDGSIKRFINQISYLDVATHKHVLYYDYAKFVSTGTPYRDETNIVNEIRERQGGMGRGR